MRRWVVLVACALLVTAAPDRATAGVPETAPASVTHDDVIGGGGRLHELTVESPALGHSVGVNVLLPAGYASPANASRRYPVLYLLHGVGDTHRSWADHTDIEGLTAPLPLIVVMPEAGKTPDSGWYSDWVDGPRWETHHIGELLPLVDARYRTIATREARATAGFSMGGFGAMSYAARHPELFVSAATISGAVDPPFAGVPGSAAYMLLNPIAGTPDDRVWGPYLTNEVRWRAHNPTDLVVNLRWTRLWAITGNGVPHPGDNPATSPNEVGVYPMNLTFDAALTDAGVEHTFIDRGYGTHDWPYREKDITAHLPLLMAILADPPPRPTAFDYRTGEDHSSAWGWKFDVSHPMPAFTLMQAVSSRGLTATGEGTLRVTSAPLYTPGHAVDVRIADATTRVAVDATGRIAFDVTLAGDQPVAVTLTAAGVIATPGPAPASSGELPATGSDDPLAWATAGVVSALVLWRLRARRPAR
jgi:S-formylglutathione hydrolase FrmB